MNRRDLLRSTAGFFAALACSGPKLLEQRPPPPQFHGINNPPPAIPPAATRPATGSARPIQAPLCPPDE